MGTSLPNAATPSLSKVAGIRGVQIGPICECTYVNQCVRVSKLDLYVSAHMLTSACELTCQDQAQTVELPCNQPISTSEPSLQAFKLVQLPLYLAPLH